MNFSKKPSACSRSNLQSDGSLDPQSVYDIVGSVLRKYSADSRKFEQSAQTIKALAKENRRLENEVYRLEKFSSKPEAMPHGSTVEVFRKFMQRDPLEAADSKVMALIDHFHSQDELLQKTVRMLSLKSAAEIPEALDTMQQAILALPKVEEFMNAVCKEVFSHSAKHSPDQVVDAVKAWRKGHAKLQAKLKKLQDALGANGHEAHARARAVSYFCRLFVIEGDDVKETVEQVYYFVYELKGFLAVSNI